MTPRERLKAKIAALQAKTEAAGCTEAEAMAAAALAARLMAEHDFEQADIEMTEAKVAHRWVRSTWRERLSATVAFVTNSAYVLDLDRQEILFVGREPGPDIAAYLRDVCFRAVDRAVREFKDTPLYRRRRKLATRRQAVADFVSAMVGRLESRLIALFRPIISEPARKEAKQALARASGDEIVTKPFADRKKPRFSGAAVAGWIAGQDVALHHGVGSSATPKLIGSGQ